MLGARGGLVRALLVVASAAALGAPTVGLAAGGGALRSTLRGWTSAHPATSALVWRLDPAGAVPVAAWRPDVARAPASTMKVVTAAGALLALGPEFRFHTRLMAGPQAVQRRGVLEGPVYLVGSGDPVLSTRSFAGAVFAGRGGNLGGLVAPLREAGIREVKGPLVADETLFDRRRTGLEWKDSYRYECPPLSALAINRNLTDQGGLVSSPAVAAGQRVRSVMRAVGIRQEGPIRAGHAPSGGRVLAEVESPTVREIVGVMNPSSDNFIAETLRKAVGAYTTGVGSTAAGNRKTAELLRGLGVLGASDRLYDGSGLSRQNALSATTLVGLLAAADADPRWGDALRRSLANGGEGTLRRRFTDGAIRRRVRAKTGYINGVSSLAGLVTSRSGARFAFAFLMNDYDIGGAQATQNRMVELLADGAGDSAGSVVTTPPAPEPAARP